jgi:hypothetical protein
MLKTNRKSLLQKEKRLVADGQRRVVCDSSRGDKTPLELFMAGIQGWEAGLRRRLDDASRKSS